MFKFFFSGFSSGLLASDRAKMVKDAKEQANAGLLQSWYNQQSLLGNATTTTSGSLTGGGYTTSGNYNPNTVSVTTTGGYYPTPGHITYYPIASANIKEKDDVVEALQWAEEKYKYEDTISALKVKLEHHLRENDILRRRIERMKRQWIPQILRRLLR
jgi:hypothetical protein